MRTTVAIDDALLEEARELTGHQGNVRPGARGADRLIQREAARRLALLGGTMPDAQHIPRRRSEPAEPDGE